MSIYKETSKNYMVGGHAEKIVTMTNQLDLDQFYFDVSSLGGTVDKPLFEAELKALPEVARKEAEVILVPGARKEGMIYGFNADTKSIVEFPFSRASSATYIDKDGLLKIAAPNTPRLEYDAQGNLLGYLLEPAAQNLCPWSNDLTKWNKASIVATVDNKKTSQGLNFCRVQKATTESSRAINYTNLAQASPGTTYHARVTMRAGNSSQISLGIGAIPDPSESPEALWGGEGNAAFVKISGPGSVAPYRGALVTVSGLSESEDTVIQLWRKYPMGGVPVGIYIYPDGSFSTNSGVYNLVAAVQFEQDRLTSYIPTEGAVGVRASDLMNSRLDLVPYSQASVYMQMAPDSVIEVGSSPMYLIRGNSLGRFWYNRFAITAYDGVNTVSIGLPNDGTMRKVCSSFGSVGLVINVNGGSIARNPFSGSMGIPGPLIFQVNNGMTKNHVRTTAIIPRQLTDAEHIAITA